MRGKEYKPGSFISKSFYSGKMKMMMSDESERAWQNGYETQGKPQNCLNKPQLKNKVISINGRRRSKRLANNLNS